MITSMNRVELVAVGAPLRATYLVAQAGYTLGVAAGEDEALAGLLEPRLLEVVTAAKGKVEAALQDRELMAQEAKDGTRGQDIALRQAKVWRRKVAKRGSRMRRMGRSVPDELTRVTQAASVPDVRGQLAVMTASFKANLDAMGGQTAQPLFDDGVRLLSELGQADAKQEATRLAKLPQKVQDFYAAKGELLIGLKIINDAGQELHADDLARAAIYNLKILHRRAGRGSATAPAAPAPA